MIWFGGERPDLARLITSKQEGLPNYIGIEPYECGDDFLTMRMPVDSRTHQPMGRLHGGASVVLAETVASVAATMCIDAEKFVIVGAEINANHVRPAFSGWVYGTARPVSMGKTLQVWDVRILDEQGKLVCISRFTGAVIPYERG